jgi:hypothetical protein
MVDVCHRHRFINFKTDKSRDIDKSACTFHIVSRQSGGQTTHLFQTSDQLRKVDVSKNNEGSVHIKTKHEENTGHKPEELSRYNK